MTELLLPERQFSKAKSELSDVMDEVVHEHRPQVVRRKGKELMLLVRPDDARRWLDTFRLHLRVVLDEGEVTVVADPLGVLGFGESLDTALDDLLKEIRAYTKRFFERQQFYAQTDAVRHEPWLARFALTHPDDHRDLLAADMEAELKSAAATKGKHAVPSAV
jgi:Antitoxin of toxin-antitoxin, RelE / RelB, TA system